MKKLTSTLLATTFVISITGVAALAADTTGNPGQGNQGCGFDNPPEYKNPGGLFQSVRQVFDLNPKQLVDAGFLATDPETVGQFINDFCKATDPN